MLSNKKHIQNLITALNSSFFLLVMTSATIAYYNPQLVELIEVKFSNDPNEAVNQTDLANAISELSAGDSLISAIVGLSQLPNNYYLSITVTDGNGEIKGSSIELPFPLTDVPGTNNVKYYADKDTATHNASVSKFEGDIQKLTDNTLVPANVGFYKEKHIRPSITGRWQEWIITDTDSTLMNEQPYRFDTLRSSEVTRNNNSIDLFDKQIGFEAGTYEILVSYAGESEGAQNDFFRTELTIDGAKPYFQTRLHNEERKDTNNEVFAFARLTYESTNEAVKSVVFSFSGSGGVVHRLSDLSISIERIE